MKTHITLWLCCCISWFSLGQSITEVEYFFNTDPGFGNANSLTPNANTGDLTQSFNLALPTDATGFNNLYVRAKDDSNTWSLYANAIVFITDADTGTIATELTAAEYFINTDPGLGNASAIPLDPNTGSLTQNFGIPIGTDLEGFNTLYIRTQDDLGNWSLYDNVKFFITESDGSTIATELTAAEYFINTDPGFGNAAAIPLNTNTGSLTQNFGIPIGTDLDGFNTLYVRTQDNLGNWSLYDNVKFFITEAQGSGASSITALEYFIDTDPGFGNATNVAANTNTGDVSQTIAIPLGTLDEGFHNLYIRTQDDLGEWSLYDKRLFFVTPEQAISPIVNAEYFYDVDPGVGNGTAVTLQPTGNLDEFTVDLSTADITCDFHDFYIRLINEDGSWSLYDYGLQIEVFDNADPTIVVFPDITVELDANGEGSITIADVDDGTFDDCELVSVVLNQPQFDYTCANLGANTVTITATDAENKVSTQDVTITVVDNIDPVAVTQNITVQLDANGEATITANDLENGSTDNCSIVNRSIDTSSFNCTNLGTNTVSFTVTDADGNTNSVDATVTVEDTALPTAVTQNITVQLDATGAATITANDVENGSTDNCSIDSQSIDVTSFDCSNLGANTVTLTVTDQSGNSNTATATVTVEDSVNPVAVTQDITVQLDASGTATILPSQIENGSTDNCTVASSSLDITTFDCSNLGSNTVTLTVTDQSGNSNTATAVVTVEDGVNPVAISQNITVQLDASGVATIAATDIDNNSTDNCGIDTRSLDISSFDCDDIGPNTVTLTVTDASGNSNSTTATVTVEDSIDPTVTTQNITVQLDASGTASILAADVENSVTDNCGVATSVVDISSFDCNDLGDNTIVLTVTDVNGNTTDTNVTVTVEDGIDPVAIPSTTTITLELDASGNGSLTGTSYDGGSTDNCSIASDTVFPSDYSCSNLGTNAATFEVTDAAGNTATAAVTVEVVDNLDPSAIGQNITVDLAGNPSVTIVAADLDNGSSDNCGSTTLSIDVDTFTASGDYPVVLTVTDASGNTDTVTVIVTVTDSLSVDDVDYSPNAITLYPNPALDKLFFDTKLTISRVQIFDLTGKKVIDQNNSSDSVRVQNLAKGVYFILFNIEDKTITKRFVKK